MDAAPDPLVEPGRWTVPLPLESLFPVPGRPLEVDVGCGKGRFLLARARARPEVDFLGIDRLLGRLRRLARKAAREGLTNVRLLRAESLYTVEYLLPPASVQTFYVFFPDPWPKRRHHRLRLFSEPFCAALDRALEPGGRVYAATDNLEYGAEIRAALAGGGRFREIEPFAPSAEEVTDFEIEFGAAGAGVARCGFAKADAGAPAGPAPDAAKG